MESLPPGSGHPHPDLPSPSIADIVNERIGRVPLVGRLTELAKLDRALAVTDSAAVGLTLLAGEAGIGKTRLLTAADQRMRGRGGLVAWGRCVDEQGAPPYLPWVDVLAQLSDQAEQAALAPGELADRLNWSLTAPSEPSAIVSGLPPEERKIRTFTSITQSLTRLARARPVLLVFDDLQWGDDASHELLRHVVIHAPAVPLVIVGAYRSEEAIGNAALTRTLDELGRRRLLSTVQIGPLGPDDTARFLNSLGVRVSPALASAICRHCDGNPFIMEEMVRALADEARLPLAGHPDSVLADLTELPLPHGVAAVINQRLLRLDAASRRMLEAAALAGREISIDVLGQAISASEQELAGWLTEAERVSLIRAVRSHGPVPSSSGGEHVEYAFLHDRVRETVVAAIPPDRRVEIHARLAVVFETIPGGDELARLAAVTYHLEQSRQSERAGRSAEHLGDASMRAHAHREAARAYQTAVQLRFPPGRPATLGARSRLLLKFGDATLAMSASAAIPIYQEAEATAAVAGDQHDRARALARRGIAHARNEELDQATACLDAAVQLWDEQTGEVGGQVNDPVERAYALVELCSIQGTSLARYDEAIQAGQRALDLALTVGDKPALEAAARLALGKALARSGRLEVGRTILVPAPALAIRGGNLDLAAEIAGVEANQAYWRGDLTGSERATRRRRELAVEASDPFALRHAWPWLALIAVSRGQWSEAHHCLAEADAEIARIDSPEPRAFLQQIAGLLALSQGRIAEAVTQLEEANQRFRQIGPATHIWYIGCLAHALLAAGERERSRQVAAEAAAILATLPVGCLPRAPTLGQLGIVASWLDDRAAMQHSYGELQPFAGQYHWVLIDRVMGMLAARLGELAAAERHWIAAEATAMHAGMRPELAIIDAERALLRVRTATVAGPKAAENALLHAAASLRQGGMPGEANRYGAAVASAPGNRKMYPAGLTAREVAVLSLLAQGLTNREIGERLGITEKTVTNHLTHVFTKADLGNRAAAVAFALRLGLDR